MIGNLNGLSSDDKITVLNMRIRHTNLALNEPKP
jgi:hypothetical protein